LQKYPFSFINQRERVTLYENNIMTDEQTKRDEYFMRLALKEAQAAYEEGESLGRCVGRHAKHLAPGKERSDVNLGGSGGST
jgi:hypothetical protein